MTLATRTPPQSKLGGTCTIGAILGKLPPDEKTALRNMLASPDWTARAIADALTDEGYPVREQPVQRHRSGGCACVEKGLA